MRCGLCAKSENYDGPALKESVDLSIVIPAYNEGERLPAALPVLSQFLENQDRTFELILVNDGSTDHTLEVMRTAERQYRYVRVVTRVQNRGKGRTLADGIAISRGELVLVSDADLSTPIEELNKLEAALAQGYDIAIASRAKKHSQIEISQPPHRVLMGKVFNLLVQALVLPGIWDTQCGFKLFKGAQARQLFAELRTDGFAYDVEILYRARKRGWTVAEVPVRWLHSAPSRVGPLRDSLAMFSELLRIRFGSDKAETVEPAPARDSSA